MGATGGSGARIDGIVAGGLCVCRGGVRSGGLAAERGFWLRSESGRGADVLVKVYMGLVCGCRKNIYSGMILPSTFCWFMLA